MKIRTDFVTNSSSSSFIAVTITKKDGTEIYGQASMGSGYHENPILYYDLKEEDIVKEAIDNSRTGIDLCHKIYTQILYDVHSVHDDLGEIRSIERFDDVSLINIVAIQEGSNGGKIDYTYDMSTKEGKYSLENVEWDYYDEFQKERITPMYDGIEDFNQNGEFEIKNGVLKKCKCDNSIVNVPDGVIGIGSIAFSYNSKIKKVCLPSTVKFIDVRAFSGCHKLEKISLPEGLECIGAKAFENCSALKEIDIPSTVVELGYKCFYGASKLVTVKIPQGVSEIKGGVFQNCEKLENVIMHEGITKIGADAFTGCHHLCEITVPEGVTHLGDSAFWECRMLQKISLPSTLKAFHAAQIYYSKNVREITVPKDSKYLKVVNGGLYTYDGKKLIKCFAGQKEFTIEEGTLYIGDYAFYQNEDIEKVNIPSTVKTIGLEAFYGCESLKEIDLPEEILSIEEDAFRLCTGLNKISLPKSLDIDLYDYFNMYNENLIVIKK